MRIYKVNLISNGRVVDYCACASLPIAHAFINMINSECFLSITEGDSCHIYNLEEVWKWVYIFEDKLDV